MSGTQMNLLLSHVRRLASGGAAEPPSDRDLLQRFVGARDEAAFAALVRRHGPMVLGVCQRLLHDRQDAEDAVQATFLVLAGKASSLTWQTSVGPWLHTVAYRLACKARVEAARRHARLGRLQDCPAAPAPDDLGWRELRALLDEELGRLPAKYRAPLVLCYLEGATRDEAAHQLGCPLGTLKGRLERGRELLRRRLTRRGVALSAALLPAGLAEKTAAAPPRFPDALTRAVLASTSGPAAAGASARAAALAQEAVRHMLLTRLKIAAVVLLAAGTLAAGAGLLARPAQEPEPNAKPQAAPGIAAAPRAENQPSSAEKRPVLRDRHGDPLPDGAVARLGTVRLRHGYNVSAVAFSPDRKTLASGGQDNTVRFWDVATGEERRRFTAITGPGSDHAWVEAIAISPDGKYLAAGTGNGAAEVIVWDLATGKERHRFKGDMRKVTSVAFSPDGKLLAAGAADTQVHLWGAATGQALRPLQGHTEMIEGIAFAPDGKTLASASRDKSVRLWEPATGRELRRLEGHTNMVLSVAFSPDGKTLASGSWDNTIRLWGPSTGRELRVLKGHFGAVSTIRFLGDGQTIVSGSWDNMIRLWEAATGKELGQLSGHLGPITGLALSVDGKTLASGGWDRTVRLWDLARRKELPQPAGHQHGLWSVAFSPDGKQVASGGEDATVRLWESATGKEVRRLGGGAIRPAGGPFEQPLGMVTRLDFSPDGKTVSAASWNSQIHRWETATGKPLRARRYEGMGLTPTPDRELVISGDGQGTLFVQEAATGRKVRRFKAQAKWVCVAVSADGRLLAAGSPAEDGTVLLWDLVAGKELRRCKGAGNLVYALAFSPDGKYLAGATANIRVFIPDAPVFLWDVATGREVRRFQGHTNTAVSLVFSTDGRTLASGAGDKTVRLWEVATGKERRRFEGHQGGVRDIALSPDGTRLASASQDTTVLIWDATGLESPAPAPARKLSAHDLQSLWGDLTGDDAAKAYRAIWMLARHPEQGVPLLREHLRPARALEESQQKQVGRWLADLDSSDFAVRNGANAELEKLGLAVEPILRKALAGRPALEQRKRIERLLERMDRERLSLGRALEALEHTATPEAQRLLDALAKGQAESWLTRQAKAALERMARGSSGE